MISQVKIIIRYFDFANQVTDFDKKIFQHKIALTANCERMTKTTRTEDFRSNDVTRFIVSETASPRIANAFRFVRSANQKEDGGRGRSRLAKHNDVGSRS